MYKIRLYLIGISDIADMLQILTGKCAMQWRHSGAVHLDLGKQFLQQVLEATHRLVQKNYKPAEYSRTSTSGIQGRNIVLFSSGRVESVTQNRLCYSHFPFQPPIAGRHAMKFSSDSMTLQWKNHLCHEFSKILFGHHLHAPSISHSSNLSLGWK